MRPRARSTTRWRSGPASSSTASFSDLRTPALMRRASRWPLQGDTDYIQRFASPGGVRTFPMQNQPVRPFLGVERSVCGRPWRDRLDERATARALAIAQRHGIPELLARVLAGRGVEVDEVEAFLDPTVRRLLPDPTCSPPWSRGAPHRRCDGARRKRRHLRRLRCRWRDRIGLAGALPAHARRRSDRPYPRPDFRGLRPERRGDPRARRARRQAPHHRRLRHRQHRAAGRGAQARPRRHRHRPPSGRRSGCRTRWWSIPTGSTTCPSLVISPPSGSSS